MGASSARSGNNSRGIIVTKKSNKIGQKGFYLVFYLFDKNLPQPNTQAPNCFCRVLIKHAPNVH